MLSLNFIYYERNYNFQVVISEITKQLPKSHACRRGFNQKLFYRKDKKYVRK